MSNRLTQAANIQVIGVPSEMGGKGRKLMQNSWLSVFQVERKLKYTLSKQRQKNYQEYKEAGKYNK